MAVRIPIAGEPVVVIAALHLAQDFLIPVQIVILSVFLTLAGQFLQNRLSVLDGGGEHLLPVLRYGFEVKFVNVRIMLQIGVHHQALQQRFVLRLDEHRHKAFFDTFPSGIAVCRHDGVIICHGWEIGTLAVQILHQRLSQFGGFQCVLVEVLSLPVFKAFPDHLCHGLIVVFVKGDEQVGFILELIGVIPLRAEEAEGVVVNIGRIVGAVALSVVIACKGTALLIEQHREQTAVQLIPDKLPQIHTGRINFDLFGHFAVFF